MAQYLQLVLGLSPLEAGLWTVPFALGFIVGSMVAPRLVARGCARATSWPAGWLIAALGFRAPHPGRRDDGPVASWSPAMVLQSLGIAPVFTLTNDLIIGGRAAGARRGGVGDLGDELRARRRARHRDPRQHRRPPSTVRRSTPRR